MVNRDLTTCICLCAFCLHFSGVHLDWQFWRNKGENKLAHSFGATAVRVKYSSVWHETPIGEININQESKSYHW